MDGEEVNSTYDFLPYHALLVFDAPNRFIRLVSAMGEYSSFNIKMLITGLVDGTVVVGCCAV